MSVPNCERVRRVLADPEAVAVEAARVILRAAEAAIARRGRFRIVLAGGGTPLLAYRLLARADADWGRWRVYFGDERCLPPEHPERNSLAAGRSWLERVPIGPDSVFPIPAELGAVAAARAYETLVAQALPFDLVLLGMGEDGHTASLFPATPDPGDALVTPVHDAPKPPPERVSLTARALSEAHEVLILVTGAGKREAVGRWQAGVDLPVARIRARHRLRILLDRAAAGE